MPFPLSSYLQTGPSSYSAQGRPDSMVSSVRENAPLDDASFTEWVMAQIVGMGSCAMNNDGAMVKEEKQAGLERLPTTPLLSGVPSLPSSLPSSIPTTPSALSSASLFPSPFSTPFSTPSSLPPPYYSHQSQLGASVGPNIDGTGIPPKYAERDDLSPLIEHWQNLAARDLLFDTRFNSLAHVNRIGAVGNVLDFYPNTSHSNSSSASNTPSTLSFPSSHSSDLPAAIDLPFQRHTTPRYTAVSSGSDVPQSKSDALLPPAVIASPSNHLAYAENSSNQQYRRIITPRRAALHTNLRLQKLFQQDEGHISESPAESSNSGDLTSAYAGTEYDSQGEDEKPNDVEVVSSSMKRARIEVEDLDDDGCPTSTSSSSNPPRPAKRMNARYTYADLVAEKHPITLLESQFPFKPAECESCIRGLTRSYDMVRHVKAYHLAPLEEESDRERDMGSVGGTSIRCNRCQTSFSREDALKRHANANKCRGKKRKRRARKWEMQMKARNDTM